MGAALALAPVVAAPGTHASAAREPAAGQAANSPGPLAASPEVEGVGGLVTLGSGVSSIHLVDYGREVSIYANSVPADYLLNELRKVGGPTYSALAPLNYAISLALHRVSWQELFDRVFEVFSVSYHFEQGRPKHIRVLSLKPGRNYRPPTRPPQTEAEWMDIELGTENALRP